MPSHHHPIHFLDRASTLAMRAMMALSKGGSMGPEHRGQFDEMTQKTLSADGVAYGAAQVGGVSGWWCRPNKTKHGAAILYLHGGAYVLGSARAYRHLAGQIAARVEAAVFVPDYALAPEHPFPGALEDARSAYRGLVQQGFSRIALSGDSAGGGLALALLSLLTTKADEQNQPVGAAVLSPWTDLALSGASMDARAKADPLLTKESLAASAKMYLGAHDAHDPHASPLYGNLAKLPPVRIHVGEDEILLDDSLRYGERLERAGGTCQVHTWEGMTHVFPSHLGLRAAKEALNNVGAFLRQRLLGSPDQPNSRSDQDHLTTQNT